METNNPKSEMNLQRIIGMLIGIVALGLTYYWFSWKLVLVIFLSIYGNNLEQAGRFKAIARSIAENVHSIKDRLRDLFP